MMTELNMCNKDSFEIDEYQQRYLDDLETKDWLEKVIRALAEKQFPILKKNIQDKDLLPILEEVVQDARKYGFEDDSEILVRYGIYAANNNITPMNNPALAEAIRQSETVVLGIKDQIALADWAARNEELFGMEVQWEER